MNKSVVKQFLLPLWIVALLVMTAGTAWSQQAQPVEQFVESPERFQQRVEGLIHERLSALVPGGQFLLKVNVQGRMARVPRADLEPGALELPGFRPSSGERESGEERFLVEQVLVRVVLNKALPDNELQYIRTIVPILADFRPERGDRLELQTVTPQTDAAAADQAKGPPVIDDSRWPKPFGLSLIEWAFIILGGVFLLILMVVFFRLLSRLITTVMPESKHASAPPTAAQLAQKAMAAEDKDLEDERKKVEEERRFGQVRMSIIKRLLSRPELGKVLLDQWQDSPGKINMLIHGLGQRVARQALMTHLGAQRYQELEEAVLTEKVPEKTRLTAAMQEASVALLTSEITHPELTHPNPFKFLGDMGWQQVAMLVKSEPVKVKAMVLSSLKPETTARVLETMPQETQLEVAVNMGNLSSLPMEMVSAVAEDLAEKARELPGGDAMATQGPRGLVDIMGRSNSQTSKYLLRSIKTKDMRLSEQVERLFFLFESIPAVPEEVLPQAIRTMPSAVVVQALQGADSDLQRRVIMAFPERARPGIVTSLRAANFDQDTIQEARRQVVARFQQLADQGKIDLKKISDAWQGQGQARAS